MENVKVKAPAISETPALSVADAIKTAPCSLFLKTIYFLIFIFFITHCIHAVPIYTKFAHGYYRNVSDCPTVFYISDDLNEMLKNCRKNWVDGTKLDCFEFITKCDSTAAPNTDRQFCSYKVFNIVSDDLDHKTGKLVKENNFQPQSFSNYLKLNTENNQVFRYVLSTQKTVVVKINDNRYSVRLIRIDDIGQYRIWDPFSTMPPYQQNDNFLQNQFQQLWKNPLSLDKRYLKY